MKNIIFDLGVVLLDVDYNATINAFSKLGLENPEMAFSKKYQDELFKGLERGKISDEEFYSAITERTCIQDTIKIRNAWCAMLKDFPVEKYELLRRLSTQYRLFLLSNTNHIHQDWFESHIEERFGLQNFKALFEKVGYSHQLGERKPDKAAFEKILIPYNLRPEETLFVDDTIEHVNSAKNLGIKGVHYKEGENLEELLSAYLQV